VVGVLAAAEVAVRSWPLPASDLRALHELRPDRPWLFGLKPGARRPIAGADAEYVVNADRVRGSPVAKPKPRGTFRIALVGDSIAFGWAVPEEATLGKRLERRLNAWSEGPKIETVNLGVSGYNPYTEAKWFAEIGPVLEPDLVVVQFCVNDLNDPTLHFDYATRTPLELPDEAFPDPGRRPPPASLADRWCAASRACSLLRARMQTPSERAYALEGVAPHGDPTAAEIEWLGDRYAEIAGTASDLDARFALAVFPYSTQLEPKAPAALQDALRELGAERRWPVVDLLPAYRDARAKAPTEALFIDLWHPTAAGYEVGGSALAAALACAGLVPVSPPPGACASGDGEPARARQEH
jgi:lysophospholipase L1-like esterase